MSAPEAIFRNVAFTWYNDIARHLSVLVLAEVPKNKVPEGLHVLYGQGIPFDAHIEHVPTIVRDIDNDRAEYYLPFGFDPESITEVKVDSRAF